MAFDAFLFFDGAGADKLKGESTDKTFSQKKACEIFSFSWGASNPSSIGSQGGGSGSGKVSISSFNVMKRSDAMSPALFLACCNGDHIGAGHVVLRKAGGGTGGADSVPFITYDFTEVMVDSIQWSGSQGGDDTPTESLSFSFAKVDAKYTPQGVKGEKGTPIPFSFDVTTNSSE